MLTHERKVDIIHSITNFLLDKDIKELGLECERGEREVEPEDGYRQFEVTDSYTLTLYINGGAKGEAKIKKPHPPNQEDR